MKIALDIGGVLSKYPEVFRPLAALLIGNGIEVFVITDMHDKAEVLKMLGENGFGFITSKHVFCADYTGDGEHCKAALCQELGIDIFVDDFIGYVADPGAKVRLLMMPDSSKPYWADDWVAEGDFGRRKRTDGTK